MVGPKTQARYWKWSIYFGILSLCYNDGHWLATATINIHAACGIKLPLIRHLDNNNLLVIWHSGSFNMMCWNMKHINIGIWKMYYSNCIWSSFQYILWRFRYHSNKQPWPLTIIYLTHWGRVTHIYVDKLTIIDSDNGLLPGRRQAIIWTNAGILLIGPLWTNFN